MSNFNEHFKSKGAKTLVDRFFNKADLYSENKLISIDFELEPEPLHQASYYIENGLTATHKVILKYRMTDDPDEIKYSEFEVPREIDGAFIIEGAYRIATDKLGSSYDCRIKIPSAGEASIFFDYSRKFDINRKVLKVKRNDSSLSLADQEVKFKYDQIDKLSGPDKELLRLTEEQSKKFQIKLDLNYVPEYIDTRLIDECIAFGDDRYKDLIVDKFIESVPSGFLRFMFRSKNGMNYKVARRNIAYYIQRYGRIQEKVTPITNLATSFFKGVAELDSSDTDSVQVPPGINAMNLDTLGKKVSIHSTVAYNSTMSDLIDLADTPINQNTNLQNSLTVSTHVTDDGVLFDVFDKEFRKITIQYLDYLNKKVCASEYVDYGKKQIKPDKDGKVEVKYRMKRIMVDAGEIDLVDLHPDYRLSSATRRIPFINFTDSVRISMGTSMLKQSIPLVNAQRSLVDTGRDEELSDNLLNEKFKHDSGVIKEINDDKIIIETSKGELVEHPRRTAIQSINDVSVYTEPKVKVGQKVTRGDIITGPHNLEKNSYKVGLNTLVLFHAYHGLVNEDALVVSQSYANRMCHYSIVDLSFNVKNMSAIKWIAPIGTKVAFKDKLLTIIRTNKLDEVNKLLTEKLGGLFGEGKDLSEYTTEDYLRVPNNIDEAWISDVKIQEQLHPQISKSVKSPDYTFTRSSRSVIKEYEDNMNRKVIYDQFPEYVAADRLREINMDPAEYKIVYNVRFRLIKKTGVMVGSKITNRFGGKGVVSMVKPDELMPLMVDKATGKQHRVEVVMNPYSTINRKIAGVLVEQNLGLIAHRLRDLVESYKKTKTGKAKIIPLLSKYYPGRYDNMDPEAFIELHDTKPIEEVYYFNVGCYSDFSPANVETWMDELGLESQSEILMPEEEVSDLDELREVLGEEEYQKHLKSIKGKFRPVEKKLQCGWMTLEELYHIPSYSNKVTSSLFGVDINSKREEPILGRSRYRETGQSIGEMELAVLLARNAKPFIESTRKDTAREDNQIFLNNLLALGLTVSSEDGFNQGGSSLKDDLKNMKAKFRLKNSR